VADALDYLVTAELAFGGQLTTLTPTNITVVTRVMSCIDTTTFEGSVDEMQLLVEAAAVYTSLTDPKHESLHNTIVDAVMAVTKGVPLMIHLGADMIRGKALTKLTVIMLLGPDVDVQAALTLSFKDLCAVLTLVRLDGVAVADALDLAVAA
jgi:hypothetical protein